MDNDKATTKPIDWVKSPDGICEVYSNMVHVTWSMDDVRIRLGQLVDSPETPNPGEAFVGVSEERAAITLTWRMAKLLRDQLSGVINRYEKVNGSINISPTLPPGGDFDSTQ
jgi:hypothetical protein